MTSPNRNKYLLAGLLSFALALVVTLWLKKRSLEESLTQTTTTSVAENLSAPPTDTQSLPEKMFADILLTEFKTFDPEKIKSRIEMHNLEIRKKFNLTDDQIAMPKDFHRFELVDSANYAALNQEFVQKAHTDGVDDGLDLIKTDIFSKTPFQKVLSTEGPVYFIPKSDKVISLPTENSCLGNVPTGAGRVYNLKTQKEIFKFDFPDGTREAVILENTKPNEFHFDLVLETPLTNPQTTCEIGDPVQIIKTSYLITCHNDNASCLLVANETERADGCPHVGGCD